LGASGQVEALQNNMVRLAGGRFSMGSEERETEKPLHPVDLEPFEIAATPVTQSQYEEIMKNNPSRFKDPDSPVECVSWNDATRFCKKLSTRTKQNFTLPSEAQWEYACRVGTTTSFCFGDNDDVLDEYAWYDKNSENRTHPVAKKKPNPWGLYDMHGNVWEWCLDKWHDSYKEAPANGSAWVDEQGLARVVRGGSWSHASVLCRSASRYYLTPDDRFSDVGFRVVRTP
jgi:formylglycine-generating enzyme required for sulfatase activity